MTDPLADWWVHDIQVERKTGAGAYGDTYASPETVTGLIDDTRRLVRTGAGEETMSSASVFLPIGTTDVPLGSRVTLPAAFGGRGSTVIAVARHEAGSQPVPAHIEIHLL